MKIELKCYNGKDGYAAKPVYQYKDGNLVGEYASLTEASEKVGFSQSSISKSARTERPFHGFLFTYEKI